MPGRTRRLNTKAESIHTQFSSQLFCLSSIFSFHFCLKNFKKGKIQFNFQISGPHRHTSRVVEQCYRSSNCTYGKPREKTTVWCEAHNTHVLNKISCSSRVIETRVPLQTTFFSSCPRPSRGCAFVWARVSLATAWKKKWQLFLQRHVLPKYDQKSFHRSPLSPCHTFLPVCPSAPLTCKLWHRHC